MTALNLSTIPSQINTYERLLVWAAQCVEDIANGAQINAVSGTGNVPAVQVQKAITADNRPRFVISAYLEVDNAALNSATQKTWMATKDLSDAAPHVNLLTN